MINIKLVYNDKKDKEFLDNINLKTPIFVNYININTTKGKKEGWKLMNYYGTTTFPFIEIEIDDKQTPLYSENGNAVFQLIDYLKVYDCKN